MKPRFTTVQTKKEFKIAVINPDNGELVPITDWEKGTNLQRALFVCISTDGNKWLAIDKYTAAHGRLFNFADANQIAANIMLKQCEGATFRLPTRHECIDMYDARFAGLDDALSLIGGDPLTGFFWTCESKTDPKCNATSAFFFFGDCGTLGGDGKYGFNAIRPVTTFEV